MMSQKNGVAHCKRFLNVYDFDHIGNNRSNNGSNNDISNCQAFAKLSCKRNQKRNNGVSMCKQYNGKKNAKICYGYVFVNYHDIRFASMF
jgi:hypothetical protein